MKNKLSSKGNEYGTLNPKMKVSKNPAPKKMTIATAFLEEYVAAQKKKNHKGKILQKNSLIRFYKTE
jgi:hypothetical protein